MEWYERLYDLFFTVPSNVQDLMAWLIAMLIAAQIVSIWLVIIATTLEITADYFEEAWTHFGTECKKDKTALGYCLRYAASKVRSFSEASRGF